MYWLITWIILILIAWAIFYGADCPCKDCDIYLDDKADRSYCFHCERGKKQ